MAAVSSAGREFVEPGRAMVADPVEHVGKPGFGVDVVEFGGCDQGVDRPGPFAASYFATNDWGLPPRPRCYTGRFPACEELMVTR